MVGKSLGRKKSEVGKRLVREMCEVRKNLSREVSWYGNVCSREMSVGKCLKGKRLVGKRQVENVLESEFSQVNSHFNLCKKIKNQKLKCT